MAVLAEQFALVVCQVSFAEHMTPINSQGVKDGNHPKTRSLE